ncbi:MAG: hypothetical protein ACK50S_00145 [bacterium]|jgi:hypothetical protein
MNYTTRRFPRTADEAFPGSASYACPITSTPRSERLLSTGWGVVGVLAVSLYLIAVLSRWWFY